MRVEHEVDLSRVIMDRVPLDGKTLVYANLMAQGTVFPAIKCALRSDGMLEVRDGRHRWAASRLAGKKTILVRHSTEPLRQGRAGARWWSFGTIYSWSDEMARLSEEHRNGLYRV